MTDKTSKYENQRPRRNPPFAPLGAIRASHGLTLKDVCTRVEAVTNQPFSVGALSGLENGHRGASPEILAALETALRLPAGTLVTDYEPSHSRRKLEQVEKVPA